MRCPPYDLDTISLLTHLDLGCGCCEDPRVSNKLTGFAARARVLLVNRDRLSGREPPQSIRDLADPRWKGEATLANPLFGTTTMHAAALFAAWGDEEANRFFQQLKDNNVRVASSNGEVKRLVVAGEATFGLTDTDDANEALKENAPVDVIYPDQDAMGTLVMPSRRLGHHCGLGAKKTIGPTERLVEGLNQWISLQKSSCLLS